MTLEQIKQAIEDRIKELEQLTKEEGAMISTWTDQSGRGHHVSRRMTDQERELMELRVMIGHG
jgi:hypothetical protein